ncbi:hypothetical protein ATANTOWER_001788 [Ataeniobius toweri]|uniref:Uncharacterized protein n=1 Tax=Ataeniobius toweri TaxID=208326 RepID=A0ABU7CBU8_9TELE|nr:hypothetical protein [Ataeniobius toweri]
MFRFVRYHQAAPQTVQELGDVLVRIWEEIPQDTNGQVFRSRIILCVCCYCSMLLTSPLVVSLSAVFPVTLDLHCIYSRLVRSSALNCVKPVKLLHVLFDAARYFHVFCSTMGGAV